MPNARLVVADAGTVSANDQILIDHLRTGLGLTVSLDSDENTTPDLTGIDVVILSESCNSTTLGTTYTDVAVPVLTMENGGWDEMKFGTDSTGPVHSAVDVIDDTHVVAAGYSGTGIEFYDSSLGMRQLLGKASGVVEIARAAGTTDPWPVVFVVESGDALTSGTAAARRAGIGMIEANHPNATGAWDFVAAAVRWLLGDDTQAMASSALLVRDSSAFAANESEKAVRTRLRAKGFDVTTVDDATITTTQADDADLVVMSKTVVSTDVGSTLHGTTTPVLFWEDNQQQESMLATIDTSNVTGTAWHATGTDVALNGSAPAALLAELSGTITLYRASGEITYAPLDDSSARTLVADADDVAEFGTSGDGRWAIYLVRAGDTLSDAAIAAGHRGYFGLYDDTYRLLTNDGVALFDAMVDELSTESAQDSGTLIDHDFTGDNGDPWPSPWTSPTFFDGTTGGILDIQSNRGRMRSHDGSYTKARTDADGIVSSDGRIEFIFRFPDLLEKYPYIFFRASAAWDEADEWTKVSGYAFTPWIANSETRAVTLVRLDSGTETDLDEDNTFTFAADTDYYVTIDFVLADITVTIRDAPDGTVLATLSAVDSDYLTGGIAVSLLSGSAGEGHEWTIDSLLVTENMQEGSGSIESTGSFAGVGETDSDGAGSIEVNGSLAGTGDAATAPNEGSGSVSSEGSLEGTGHNNIEPPPQGGGGSGGAIYGIDFYGTDYYGIPRFLEFDASPFVAEPYGYGTLRITWGTPSGEWTWVRVVRNSYGAPDFESDGSIIAEIFGHSSNEIFDRDLREGNFYYYSIFFYAPETGSWHRGGITLGLVSKNFGYGDKLFSWIPGWFQEQDNVLGHNRRGGPREDDRGGPLKRFLGVVGLGADYTRTELETLRWTRRPERVSSELLPYLAHQYGVPVEPAIGMRRTRFWLRDAVFLYHRKGTLPGIQDVVTTITGWDCNVSYGPNLLRGIDSDAWFIENGTIEDTLATSHFDIGDIRTNITLADGQTEWTISNAPIPISESRYHGIQILEEEPYGLVASFWTDTGTVNVEAELAWFDSGGFLISTETLDPAIAVDDVGATQVALSVFSPVNAVYAIARFRGDGDVHFERAKLVHGDGSGDWTPPMMLDIEMLPNRTNYVTNPSFEFGLTTWTIDEGAIERAETNAVAGDAVLEVTEAGDVPILDGGASDTTFTDDMDGGSATEVSEDTVDGGTAPGIHANMGGTSVVTGGPYPIDTPEIQHALSVRTLDSTARVRLRWVNESLGLLEETDWVSPTEVFGSIWLEAILSSFPPADTVSFYVDIEVSEGTMIDAVMLEAADIPGDYFDGSNFGGDYLWSGQPHFSASRFYPQRAVRSARLRDLLPDYLPLGQTFNIRFVADTGEGVGLEAGPGTMGVGTLGIMDLGQ